MLYYYEGVIKFEYFDLDNILICKKSYQNILVYRISYKTLIGAKPFYIRFNKINGFIRVYDGIINLVLLGAEQYDFIYSRIRYFIGIKSGITYLISHNYAKIKAISLIFVTIGNLKMTGLNFNQMSAISAMV